MLKVKLVKISSTHNNLRTSEIEGHCTSIPQVGYTFTMFAPPLESGNIRNIWTTHIKTCDYNEAEKKFTFTTQNSTYTLDVLEDKNVMDYSRKVL